MKRSSGNTDLVARMTEIDHSTADWSSLIELIF